MPAAPGRSLGDLFAPATAVAVLAALFVAAAPMLEAHATHLPKENFRRTYPQGMPDGRVFGFEDGYRDGFQLTYRRSFNNRVPNRVQLVVYPQMAEPVPDPHFRVIYPEMPQVVPGPRYIEGYRRGYAEAYDRGFGAGRRDGRDADRSDLALMREKLRCRMDRSTC